MIIAEMMGIACLLTSFSFSQYTYKFLIILQKINIFSIVIVYGKNWHFNFRYEDAAYDHAGHEKKAEQDQNYSAFEKEKLARGDTKKLKEKQNKVEAEVENVEEDGEEDTENEPSKIVPLVLGRSL